MQIVRTVIWVVLVIALLIFAVNNWTVVQVKIWENLIWETKLPMLLLIAFLLGMLPMWLLHAGTRWRLNRQISSLKDAAAVTSGPSLSTTSLAEAQPENPAN
ncbi:LapA family protein [Novosphingobium sp. MW5]|nr:LapA family protein [Novosphingobium sp. MW5]